MAENNEDFNDMCVRLVETVKDGTTGDLIRNVDIIHEVAEYCRNTKIYTQNKDKADAFFKDMDAWCFPWNGSCLAYPALSDGTQFTPVGKTAIACGASP